MFIGAFGSALSRANSSDVKTDAAEGYVMESFLSYEDEAKETKEP